MSIFLEKFLTSTSALQTERFSVMWEKTPGREHSSSLLLKPRNTQISM